MELRSSEALKQVVEAGLGLAVVSLHILEVELAASRLAVLNVQGFPLERHWYLVQRFDKRLSGAAQTFRKFVLDKAESYVCFRGLG
jgi:DNA-binding transcriptional LysR family regulator